MDFCQQRSCYWHWSSGHLLQQHNLWEGQKLRAQQSWRAKLDEFFSNVQKFRDFLCRFVASQLSVVTESNVISTATAIHLGKQHKTEYTAKDFFHDGRKVHPAYRVLRTHPKFSYDRSACERMLFSVTNSVSASTSFGTTHAEELSLTTNEPAKLVAANDYVAPMAPFSVPEMPRNAEYENRRARPRGCESEIRLWEIEKYSKQSNESVFLIAQTLQRRN